MSTYTTNIPSRCRKSEETDQGFTMTFDVPEVRMSLNDFVKAFIYNNAKYQMYKFHVSELDVAHYVAPSPSGDEAVLQGPAGCSVEMHVDGYANLNHEGTPTAHTDVLRACKLVRASDKATYTMEDEFLSILPNPNMIGNLGKHWRVLRKCEITSVEESVIALNFTFSLVFLTPMLNLSAFSVAKKIAKSKVAAAISNTFREFANQLELELNLYFKDLAKAPAKVAAEDTVVEQSALVAVKTSRGVHAEVDFHHEDDAKHEDFELLTHNDLFKERADNVAHYDSVRSHTTHRARMMVVLHSASAYMSLDAKAPGVKAVAPDSFLSSFFSCCAGSAEGTEVEVDHPTSGSRKLFLDHEHPEAKCLTHSLHSANQAAKG